MESREHRAYPRSAAYMHDDHGGMILGVAVSAILDIVTPKILGASNNGASSSGANTVDL